MRCTFPLSRATVTMICCLVLLLARGATADDIFGLLTGMDSLPGYLRVNDEEPDSNDKLRNDQSDLPKMLDHDFRTAQVQPVQPVQPVPAQPMQPMQPMQTTPGEQPGVPEQTVSLTAAEATESESAIGQKENIQAAGQANPTDIGTVLASSEGADSLSVEHRSEVAYDPTIRGYKEGQIYSVADGAYWYSTRQDMDTMLSHLDPALIGTVDVIPGPYGVQYGPGFSFIDVQTTPTPRSDGCDLETSYRSLGMVRPNGGQVYGREIVEGASGDWGFRFTYGIGKGSEYRAGDDATFNKVPAAYNNQDECAQIGYDFSPCTHLEMAYQRNDQYNTVYPGRLFNIDHMGTDAFNLRLNNDDANSGLTWSVSGWYNRTGFAGSIDNNDANFPVNERIEQGVDFDQTGGYPIPTQTTLAGTTTGNALSSGTRAGLQIGDTEEVHLNAGTDFRYLQQELTESFDGTNTTVPANALGEFGDNMPTSYMRDPGLYAMMTIPWTCYLKSVLGGRWDYVATDAQADQVNPVTQFSPQDVAAFSQHNALYAYYLTNEAKLDENWTAKLAFGSAGDPPTLVERYTDGNFVGVAQDSFTKLLGNPALKPEQDYQIDLSLQANFDNWRGRASAYQAWVHNYIGYTDDFVGDPDWPEARTLRFINIQLATLTGFELSGEYDWNESVSLYARASFVYGVDQDLNAPLPSIPPLESFVGIRLHNPEKKRCWEIDFFAHADAAQNQRGQFYTANPMFPNHEIPAEQATPGFTTWNLHTYYYYTDNFKLVAGIDNILDKTYLEALDLRLNGPPGSNIPADTFVLAPGFSPYFGLDWTY